MKFKKTRRGMMIECLIKLSKIKNNGYEISKQGVEVGLYLTCMGSRKLPKRSYFFKSLSDLAQKVEAFSGRETFSANGLSESLKSLDHHGFIVYKYDVANKIEKHGDGKGIKIKLLKRSEYRELLDKLKR